MARKHTARHPERRAAFLETLAAGQTVSDAAKAAGIARETVYKWRKADPAFAAEWDGAYANGADALVAEARRRAVDGVAEPVYHMGRVVGTTQRYSDTLLIFLMKARAPEQYCDRARTAALARRWAAEDRAAIGDDSAIASEQAVALLARLALAKAATATTPGGAIN